MNQLERVTRGPVGVSDGLPRHHRSMPSVLLTALFAGVPVWWVLGIFHAAFFIVAGLMVAHLMRRRRIEVPKGLGIWLLFLVWLIGGLLVMQVDAPGAVPGYSGGRFLTFGYRSGWYLIGTVAALYILNTKRTFPADRVCAAIAWFFVVLTGGGMLGVLRPGLNFPSALELLLPNRLSRQNSISDLIHPNVSQVHDFLGFATARPSAPFAFSNDWGLAVAITLPFFVLVWWRREGVWRWAMLAILAVSTVPIVSSLNRGLWLSIVAVVIFTAIRSALLGRIRLLGGLLALLSVAGVIVIVSPLGPLIQARLDTPHSDEGRGNLSAQSVTSTLDGSPIIGFGTTRDVAGNFSSIAGGATQECPKCGPPPMGTHGQAWLLIFASGLGGFFLFTVFVAGQLLRHLRSRSSTAPATLACLVVLMITMPIYSSVGVPLFIGFLSIGLLAREADRASSPFTLDRLTGPIQRGAGIVLALTLLGGLTGTLVHHVGRQPARAAQSVLVPAIDLIGVPRARAFSLDSEALVARSGAVLEAVSRATGTDDIDDVSRRLSISAEPNTRVLTISYMDEQPTAASAGVDAAVRTYLAERAELHSAARRSLTARLAVQHQVLNETLRIIEDATPTFDGTGSRGARTAIDRLGLQMANALTDIHVPETEDAGHPLTEVRIRRSSDALLVRAGSGISVGAVVGLALAWHLGDRRRRISRARAGNKVCDLPVVLEPSPARAGRAAIDRAEDVVRRFRPLCGLLATPGSAAASAVAHHLDSALSDAHGRSGNRALLVAEEGTRTEAVAELRDRVRRMGVEPVGLIVVERRPKGATSK